jgi:hypothetical protein
MAPPKADKQIRVKISLLISIPSLRVSVQVIFYRKSEPKANKKLKFSVKIKQATLIFFISNILLFVYNFCFVC